MPGRRPLDPTQPLKARGVIFPALDNKLAHEIAQRLISDQGQEVRNRLLLALTESTPVHSLFPKEEILEPPATIQAQIIKTCKGHYLSAHAIWGFLKVSSGNPDLKKKSVASTLSRMVRQGLAQIEPRHLGSFGSHLALRYRIL